MNRWGLVAGREQPEVSYVVSAPALPWFRLAASLRQLWLAAAGGSMALLVAAVTIIGWKLMMPLFLTPLVGLPQTSPINAFVLIMLGTALLFTRQIMRERWVVAARLIAIACLLIAAGLALHALFLYATGQPLEFDDSAGPVESFLHATFSITVRPAPHTAATIIMLCGALACALAGGRRHLRVAAALAAVSTCIPWIALFGYASSFDPFYSLPDKPQTGMGVYTAAALLSLAFGIMGLAPHTGLLNLLSSRGIGGRLTRWLLPVAAGGPLLFGRMAVHAQEAGVFNTVSGFALICVVHSIVLAALTVLAATVLENRERAALRTVRENERLLERLRTSTSDLHELQRGFVTVCAWTRRVSDGGRWVEFEEFLQDHLHLRFSHGMSDDAADVMRQELNLMVKEKAQAAPDQQRVTVPPCVIKPVAEHGRA